MVFAGNRQTLVVLLSWPDVRQAHLRFGQFVWAVSYSDMTAVFDKDCISREHQYQKTMYMQ